MRITVANMLSLFVTCCRQLIYSALIHIPSPPFLCSSNSTHNILPHGSYCLVLRLIETIFAQATPSRPSIAAGTSQSTNFRLTQGQSTLKFPLMGMVYTLSAPEVCASAPRPLAETVLVTCVFLTPSRGSVH